MSSSDAGDFPDDGAAFVELPGIDWSRFAAEAGWTIVFWATLVLSIWSATRPPTAAELHAAVARRDADEVARLLDAGVHVDGVDPRSGYDRTPLIQAAVVGDVDTVVALLEGGASVDARAADGSTPLTLAASGGHSGTVETLLSHGADIEGRSANGMTPLMFAATRGHAVIVELLMSKGANVDVVRNDGGKVLEFTAVQEEPRILRLLNSPR